MNEPIDTGGPAFARAATKEMIEADCLANDGMTLLDAAALEAMKAIIPSIYENTLGRGMTAAQRQYVAGEAYDLAVAMVAEKRRREGMEQ